MKLGASTSIEIADPPHVRIAGNRRELLAAYRLVYQRYAERGFVERNPVGIIYSPEFAQGDSRTLVALSVSGQVTATATLVAKPAETDDLVQKVIPWRMVGAGNVHRRWAGVTCLASADSDSRMKPAAFFALARFLFQYARHCHYDGLVIAIHPRQLRFYRRICPIVPLTSVYRQAHLGNSLAIACRIDLDSAALSQVAPSVMSWFATPISTGELRRPGIDCINGAGFARYADIINGKSSATRAA